MTYDGAGPDGTIVRLHIDNLDAEFAYLLTLRPRRALDVEPPAGAAEGPGLMALMEDAPARHHVRASRMTAPNVAPGHTRSPGRRRP